MVSATVAVTLLLITLPAVASSPSRSGSTASGDGSPIVDAGAAVTSITPPRAGTVRDDPADCLAGLPATVAALFNGPHRFAFEEPYQDKTDAGHYVSGDPYVDCNGDGRWDGILLGGGGSTPRFPTMVADDVTARALVVTSHGQTIAVEVLDQEGLFNTYQQRIRDQVARDGTHLDNIFISATHDESSVDTLGLGGINSETSGVDSWYADFLVRQAARAIENAARAQRPARLRFAEAIEPSNLRQCWSSYPFVDDQLMPGLQAVGTDGRVIATLGDVSQHAETLGFNPDPAQQNWISSDWPHFFRSALEARFGGVAMEMAGSVGSNETPQVFASALSRTPQRFVSADHPAGCRTLFEAPAAAPLPTGYRTETAALGTALASAVGDALAQGTWSSTDVLWGVRKPICVTVSNLLFGVGAALGVFAERAGYGPGCSIPIGPLPNGSTPGTSLLSDVAAFRIGDAEFVSVPGEVFPFTFLGSYLGPQDLPNPGDPMTPMLMPLLHTPYRFVDGLAEDMIGYLFPEGNGVGVPGEQLLSNPGFSDTDRFGCNHSDDSEAASSQAADQVAAGLVSAIETGEHGARPEPISLGRYVLPDGTLSRDPLGTPGSLGCLGSPVFHPDGPAVAVWLPGRGVVRPAVWMSLSGGRQLVPDRNTRGWLDAAGGRHWLNVFPALANAPARVRL